MTYRKSRKGAALLISMIVLAILSAWAVSICSMSGTGVQLAENQRKANSARACAESGLEIIRFWLSRVSVDGTTDPSQIFTEIANSLQNDLTANGITNITPSYDSSTSTITIPDVTLDSAKGKSFSAVIKQTDPNTVRVDVTGAYRTITRTIRVNYNFGPRMNPLFEYGIATKGPLHLAGNIELGGVNVAVESSVYIESENNDEALSIIGNSQIAGDVSITNPDATVTLQGGQAGIGGETGQDAIDNHVSVGDAPIGFPVPNPGYFQQYVQNDIDTNDVVFENIRIPADTNPTFSGGVTLKGIVFIETPNVVTFTGHVSITGIIVGNGDVNDNSGTNQIIFLGTVNSYPVTDLPLEPQFDQLRNETGTFLLAPGFSVSFGGNFETINGVIAANGIEFFGDAGGTIHGTAINYSDTTMNLTGNSDLSFNHFGTVEIPAGFEFDIELKYDPASYSEVLL